MGIKDLYDNYQEVDYNAQYDLLPAPVPMPAQPKEDRLSLDPQDTIPMWMTTPPVTDVVSLTLRYQPHKTSNANTRDTLYYGICDTGGQTHVMWGFPSYVEFRSHLAVQDKELARDTWEDIKCEVAGTHSEIIFWLPKDHQGHTLNGCWAITVSDHSRMAVVLANGAIDCYGPLKSSKQNKIKISNTQPQHRT